MRSLWWTRIALIQSDSWTSAQCCVETSVRGLRVRGDQEYLKRVQQSLDLLARYPEYLAFVLDHLKATVMIDRNSHVDLASREYRTTVLVAFTERCCGQS